jgi:hypothetical protein
MSRPNYAVRIKVQTSVTRDVLTALAKIPGVAKAEDVGENIVFLTLNSEEDSLIDFCEWAEASVIVRGAPAMANHVKGMLVQSLAGKIPKPESKLTRE